MNCRLFIYKFLSIRMISMPGDCPRGGGQIQDTWCAAKKLSKLDCNLEMGEETKTSGMNFCFIPDVCGLVVVFMDDQKLAKEALKVAVLPGMVGVGRIPLGCKGSHDIIGIQCCPLLNATP